MRYFWPILTLFLVALPVAAQTCGGVSPTWTCTSGQMTSAILQSTANAITAGDTVNLASGSYTLSSKVNWPRPVQLFGSGTPDNNSADAAPSASCSTGTVLTWSATVSTNMMQFNASGSSAPLTRVSCMKIITTGSASNQPFIFIAEGTCDSGGCPKLRADNLTVPTGSMCNMSDATFLGVSGMYGVTDHFSYGDTQPVCLPVFVNNAYPSWLGVGVGGDNSWVQADSFGTANQFYLENGTLNYTAGTDMDISGTVLGGGGRVTCRFLVINNVSTSDGCTDHGTETTGQPRGGRQMEAYQNTLSCSNSAQGCVGFGERSGDFITWGNTFSNISGGQFHYYTSITAECRTRLTFWGLCAGMRPFDPNTGQATVTTGSLISSVAGSTLTVSGTPWTANAFNFSVGNTTLYIVHDNNSNQMAIIKSNTTNSLTVYPAFSNGAGFNNGDPLNVFSVSIPVNGSGTMTGTSGTLTLTDASKTWATNQWVSAGSPYEVIDLTQTFAYEPGNNTATTLSNTFSGGSFPGPQNSGSGTSTFQNGDQYVILRAPSYPLDMPGVSGGPLMTRGASGVPSCSGEGNCIPQTPYANAQTLNGMYAWMNGGVAPSHTAFGTDSNGCAQNSCFYTENANQAAQSSATSPFDGTTTIGIGHGTLANRPSTCTTGVGYFATDQGTWNTSGGVNPASYSLQGQLYKCTATNTWTLKYTPYTYPHPLIGGASTPICTPVGGNYSAMQTVTCTSTGTVICYNFNSGYIAIGGASSCPTGSFAYPVGGIAVSSSETLYVWAGGPGLADSGVFSGIYVFPTIPNPSIFAFRGIQMEGAQPQ